MKNIFCYQHNIDKYNDATSHLTLLQHGVYLRLIHFYFKTNGFLQSDFKVLCRILSCQTKAERDALSYVVGEFFTEKEEGLLRNSDLEIELSRITKLSEENRRKANAKWLKTNKTPDAAAELQHMPQHMPELCRDDANLLTNKLINNISSLSYSPFSSLEKLSDEKNLEDECDEISEAVSLWNELAGDLDLPKTSKITTQRKAKLKARLKDCDGIEGWKMALDKIRAATWMHSGKNERGWKASFDFILQESSFVKLMEGNYNARTNDSYKNGYAQQLAEMLETGDFKL